MRFHGAIACVPYFLCIFLFAPHGFAASDKTLNRAESASVSGITVKKPFSFHDMRSPNFVGYGDGEGVTYGALSVTPNGDLGSDGFADSDGISPPTIGTASQGCVPGRRLNFNPLPKFPNQFGRFSNFSRSGCRLTDRWIMTFTNGLMTTRVTTPPLAKNVLTNYVDTLWMSGGGATPTFEWRIPAGSKHNRFKIRVFDIENRVPGHIAPTVLYKRYRSDRTRFTVPAGTLAPDHLYAISIQLDKKQNGKLISRARSFFNFSTETQLAEQVRHYLPIAQLQGFPDKSRSWFTVDVKPGQTVHVSPPAAADYTFRSDNDGPRFTSVVLTPEAESRYEVTFSGSPANGIRLVGGTLFPFPDGGVDAFTLIRGDRGDTSKNRLTFPVGLRFANAGLFKGTVTSSNTDVAILKALGRGCDSALLSNSSKSSTSQTANSPQSCPSEKTAAKSLDTHTGDTFAVHYGLLTLGLLAAMVFLLWLFRHMRQGRTRHTESAKG
jgi:hypothetical protein